MLNHTSNNTFFPLQEKINREIINSKFFNGDNVEYRRKGKRKNQRAVSGDEPALPINGFSDNAKGNYEVGIHFRSTAKARSLMNLHNNEAGRRVSIKTLRKEKYVYPFCSITSFNFELYILNKDMTLVGERYLVTT